MRLTNEPELLQLTGITTLSVVVYSSGYRRSLVNDFMFCVLPQYYCIIHPERIWDVCIHLGMLLDWSRMRTARQTKSTVVDHLRFTISVIVVICIYAADFSIFNERLGKSDFFGVRLMDIGVGSFIYNAGVVGHRGSYRRYLRSCPVLFLLGLVRYFVVRMFNLNVNPREYGTHLNFYFLLGLVNLVYCAVRSRYNFLIGVYTIVTYETILRFTHLETFILSDRRSNFLEKNKEGLMALIPYTSIFLMSTEVGKICLSDDKPRRKVWRAGVLTILFGVFYLLSSLSSDASRRVGNGAFVFLVLTIHTFHLTTYMLLESMFGLYNMQTSRFCCSSMMFVFLFSNLIVLGGNVVFNLRSFSPLAAHMNLLVYLAVVFPIPAYLASRLDLGWLGLWYRS